MPNNEFDKLFKDRLTGYESPIQAVIWRRIRADWGRRRLFRARWLAGGATAVVVAGIMGYLMIRPGRPMAGRAASVAAEMAVRRTADAPAGTTETVAGTGGMGKAGTATAGTAGTALAGTALTRDAALTEAGHAGMGTLGNARSMKTSGAGDEGRSGADAAGGSARRAIRGFEGRAIRGFARRATGGAAGKGQGVTGKGPRVTGRGPGADRQGSQGYDARHYVMPSLVQVSSRAAIYAKPIKLSPAASSRQRSGAEGSDRNGHLHLDIYGSPDIPTQQFALSYTAGARIAIPITPHIFVSAGLQYSKVNVKKDSATAISYPRYFNNIDLPVLIGYTAGNDRFRFSINGGAIFNLFSHAVSPVGWGWPNRMGTSAYLGLDFAKALNDRLSLFAEPYGRCLFTYKSLLPSQTYTGGVLIGIRYHFMKR